MRFSSLFAAHGETKIGFGVTKSCSRYKKFCSRIFFFSRHSKIFLTMFEKTRTKQDQNRIRLTMLEEKNKKGGAGPQLLRFSGSRCGFRDPKIKNKYGLVFLKSRTNMFSFSNIRNNFVIVFSKDVNWAAHVFSKRRPNQFTFLQKRRANQFTFSQKGEHICSPLFSVVHGLFTVCPRLFIV